MERKYVYLLLALIVVALIGWALFFYSSITGRASFQWQPPVDTSPDDNIFLEPFPDERPGLSPGGEDQLCEDAKVIRKFLCTQIYEGRYENSCGIFDFTCRGIRDLCLEAQTMVEEECGFSD